MKTEELKRLAEAVLKAYSGLSWQVTMVRNEYGVTHYHIRSHSEPGIAVIKDQYWEDDHIPPVDHYGYIQPDDHIDCDVFRVNIARLIAAANPAAILELIQQRDELLVALEQERKRLDWALKKQAYCGRSPDRLWVDVGTGNHKWFAVHDGNPRATIDKLMAK